LQISKDCIRIPDLALLKAGRQPDTLVDPPLLVIEILSPDDTYSDTQERADAYREMGVETVWIVDPKTAQAACAAAPNGPNPGG
jgi:Uma2 family endonuclease